MLRPRRIGDVEVSPLAFGSMRLNERAHNDATWERVLAASFELGISTYHSSTEYETFDRFVRLTRCLPAGRAQHIVKLAEPHFDATAFSEERVRTKVEQYLTALSVDRVDVVQWMWRGDMRDEAGRLAAYRESMALVRDAFTRLKREGKVGCVAPFPYTSGFADVAIDSAAFEGLTIYLNPVEHEMDPQAARAVEAGMGIISIRPLGAGKALAGASATECVRSVLGQPGVATTIVSFSSLEHAAELVTGAG
jgi:aryl-alcohol dehydrogenase-like predicted oxidoreductase